MLAGKNARHRVGGSAVCAVEFILFVLSRTSGLPGNDHETWAASTEDLLGLASLLVEIVFLGCALASLRARSPRPERITVGRTTTVAAPHRTAPAADSPG